MLNDDFIRLNLKGRQTGSSANQARSVENASGELTEEEKRAFQAVLKESTPHLFITPILIGLNILVFVAMLLSGISPVAPGGQEFIAWGANFGPLTVNYQWFRLFTCTLLHIGFILAFNMWFLRNLGTVAERMFGNWTFLMLYVLS